MSRTRAVCRESWIIGRTHDGNDARICHPTAPVVIGVALHCEITARARAGGTWLIKFLIRGDYLKVRACAPAASSRYCRDSGCWRLIYAASQEHTDCLSPIGGDYFWCTP